MIRYLREHTSPPVFISSATIALALVLWGVISPSSVSAAGSAANSFIVTYFGWLYIFSASVFLIFVIVLMASRYGRIRLGPADSKPEYGTMSWFAMLFTAGMGIGLVYYAVSEPVTYLQEPPVGPGGTPQAAQNAMFLTFFHWGLHPWAIYIVLGLALGYFAFRKGLPLRPASALYPLLGERINQWPGFLVDVLAVFGTLFGLATSLGLGAQQVGAGLEALFGLTNTTTLQVFLILGITAIAVVSVMLGIDKGIRNLSLINLWLAFALMVFVFAFGPTRDLLNTTVTNVGYYLQNLPAQSFQTYPGNPAAQEWQASWTLFYWGWWISWSPFVGMFLARISYGRTIRSFIAGALFAPVGASMVWLTVFGDTALALLLQNPTNPLAEATTDTGMFVLLQQLPVAGIVSLIASAVAIIVVVLFFATSSDSGSLVVDILTNGGDPNPRWQQRLFWAVMEGVIAAVLLGAGAASGADALSALQTASILAGLPFCLVLIAMCVGLTKAMSTERFVVRMPSQASPMPGLRAAARPAGAVFTTAGNGDREHTGADTSDHNEPAEGSGLHEEEAVDPSLGETTVAEFSQAHDSASSRSSTTGVTTR
ncbi:BCCT family transporter [Actinomycetospora cinnamomea]|uniref:Choline/glycine/proline betaine transport protein n=1 Tax=Actinomycetospora cinnamomea TaxID=663609 RepID=A0A2U1F3U1_9PSEU|nr:BCCT family transporter [Actinomycetospora cinnamomea]PVZ06844.1 choline/glycine/proline betaine transport protein [Actinomycetospora cinnamomea]